MLKTWLDTQPDEPRKGHGWVCTEGTDGQCEAPVIPDGVTAFDARYTTGICSTHSYDKEGHRLKKKVTLRRKDAP